MSLSVSPAQWLDPAARAIVHHTCFKVSRKINQSDVLAKFCPTFLMTMIRHETGPFYRRPSEYAASLGEQTLTHQRYRERLSIRGVELSSWSISQKAGTIGYLSLLYLPLYYRAFISSATVQHCPLE